MITSNGDAKKLFAKATKRINNDERFALLVTNDLMEVGDFNT